MSDINSNQVTTTEVLKDLNSRLLVSFKNKVDNEFIGAAAIKGVRSLTAAPIIFYKNKIREANHGNIKTIQSHLRKLNVTMKTEALKGTPLDPTILMAYFNSMEVQKQEVKKYFPWAQVAIAITQDPKINFMPMWNEVFSGNNVSGQLGTLLFLSALTYDTYVSWTVEHLMSELQRFYTDPKLGNLLNYINGGNSAALFTGMYEQIIRFMADIDFGNIHQIVVNEKGERGVLSILQAYTPVPNGKISDIISNMVEAYVDFKQNQFGGKGSFISIFSLEGMQYADMVQREFDIDETRLQNALRDAISNIDLGRITAEELYERPDVSALTTMYLTLIIERDLHAKLRQMEKSRSITILSKMHFNSNANWYDDVKPVFFGAVRNMSQENAKALYDMQLALVKKDVYDSRYNGGFLVVNNQFYLGAKGVNKQIPRVYFANGSNEVDGVVGTGDLLGFDCARVRDIILRTITIQRTIMSIPRTLGTTEDTAFTFQLPANLFKQFFQSWKTEVPFANLNNVVWSVNGGQGDFQTAMMNLMRYNDPNKWIQGSYILTETPAFPINIDNTTDATTGRTNLISGGIYWVKFIIMSDQAYNIIGNPISNDAKVAVKGQGNNYNPNVEIQKIANVYQHSNYCVGGVYKSLAISSPNSTVSSTFNTKLAAYTGNPNVLLARLINSWDDLIFTEMAAETRESAEDDSGLIGRVKISNGEGAPSMMALKTLPQAKGMVRGDNNQAFGVMIADAIDICRIAVNPMDIIVEAMADFGDATPEFDPADQTITMETNTGVYSSGN